MSNLALKGKVNVCGMEVPNIYGGFGENQKVILAKTVADLHNVELSVVNRNINRHIKDEYFEIGIDFIDLKNDASESLLLEMGFSKRDISISKNIYLLSQQGYTLLLKLMNSKLAKEQYKQVIRDYFIIKESIQYLTQEELKQLVSREDGIIRRNRETAAITRIIQRKELIGIKNPYGAVTNTTYDILYGMHAKDIRSYLNLRQQDNLRDFLSKKDLDKIREIEDEIHWMEKKGYTWQEIYKDLLKEFTNKTKPEKAIKSIKEIIKSKKIAIKENEIKLLK